MSIVTVHGPYMMYGLSAAVVKNAGGSVTPNNANAAQFSLVGNGDRAAIDYDWTFSDGTAAISDNKGPVNVTFATPGSKTITLTVGSSAGTTPPATTYTYVVQAGASGAPRSEEEQQALPASSAGYDPGAHTVDQVLAYAEDHIDEVQNILDAEQAGRNRVTLVGQLEDMV